MPENDTSANAIPPNERQMSVRRLIAAARVVAGGDFGGTALGELRMAVALVEKLGSFGIVPQRLLDELRSTVESGHNCGPDGVDSDYLCAMDDAGTEVVSAVFGVEAVRHPANACEPSADVQLTKEECWCKSEGAPFN
ncbi:MAG: hypothetical protein KGJ23_08075 [Euryarchaeota archaeon]|nr:hypothetical protein [Euryarchaeota archaeon]MDE1836558.1 hypothetical protein [Euryarchaeota archaeon]MDE1879247.1 hypothetical protein [Euryarchaeota archaeon]MDE2044528.1 hypothetical protein [Thermoplasmata archaeon]